MRWAQRHCRQPHHGCDGLGPLGRCMLARVPGASTEWPLRVRRRRHLWLRSDGTSMFHVKHAHVFAFRQSASSGERSRFSQLSPDRRPPRTWSLS